ncbi:DUF362 domain-containing protein [Candidatus Bathyarchaeota archaeon]|nr:DUF362 domain-containing protein [Candidatus Bathyarchaeota archaeon]
MPKVALIRVEDHSYEAVYQIFKKWLSQIIDPAIFQQSKIIIKPNLCAPLLSETGATTDVRIVEALIAYINEINPSATIFVVESDVNSGVIYSPDMLFLETGYNQLEKRYSNVKLVDLSRSSQTTINNEGLKHFKESGLSLANVLTDGVFVSVAKLKTSVHERYTGILKNQFGCLSTSRKDQYHPYLSKVLTDLNFVLEPKLCIIDGLIGMEGLGPTAGKPKKMNLLIIGNNPVATDAVGATVMGINPKRVTHLKAAAKRELGEIDVEAIEVLGERIQNVKEKFKFINEISYQLLRLSFAVVRWPLPKGVKFFIAKHLHNLARALY